VHPHGLRLGEAVSRDEPVAKDFAEAAVSIADLDGDVTRKRMPDDTDLATGADGLLEQRTMVRPFFEASFITSAARSLHHDDRAPWRAERKNHSLHCDR
jgi:hypothetical protein